jgi:hypothetical protein
VRDAGAPARRRQDRRPCSSALWRPHGLWRPADRRPQVGDRSRDGLKSQQAIGARASPRTRESRSRLSGSSPALTWRIASSRPVHSRLTPRLSPRLSPRLNHGLHAGLTGCRYVSAQPDRHEPPGGGTSGGERTRAPSPTLPALPPRPQLAAHPSARCDALASAVRLHDSSPQPPQARLHAGRPLVSIGGGANVECRTGLPDFPPTDARCIRGHRTPGG